MNLSSICYYSGFYCEANLRRLIKMIKHNFMFLHRFVLQVVATHWSTNNKLTANNVSMCQPLYMQTFLRCSHVLSHVSTAEIKTFQSEHVILCPPTSGGSCARRSSIAARATHTRLLYCQHQQLSGPTWAAKTSACVCFLRLDGNTVCHLLSCRFHSDLQRKKGPSIK